MFTFARTNARSHLRVTVANGIRIDVSAATTQLARSSHASDQTFGITEVPVIAVFATIA